MRGRGLRGLRGPRRGIDVSEWAVIYSARRAARPLEGWRCGRARTVRWLRQFALLERDFAVEDERERTNNSVKYSKFIF